MSELEQLRQEAEQLKNQIRVSDTICFPIQHLAFVCWWVGVWNNVTSIFEYLVRDKFHVFGCFVWDILSF